MSESIPFLGSKISLISKSEIRYEGILYTIDAQDSIIVLTKVQSFGTEDRPADLAVPAKNDIYEYIIFRGTDIKKIEVCDPPKHQISGLHNDPAIVSLQVQQQAAPTAAATSYPGTSFSHQPLGAIGSVGNYYGSYNQPLGQPNIPTSGYSIGVSQPSEFSSGLGSTVGGGMSLEPQTTSAIGGSGGGSNSQPLPAPIGAPPQSGIPPQSHQQDVLAGSRSSTPGLSRKSPVADAGVQVSPPAPQRQQEEKRRSLQSNQRNIPERQNRDGPNNAVRRGQYQQGPNQYNQGNRYNNQGYQGSNQGYYQGQQYQGGQYRGGNTGRGRAPRRAQGQRGRGVFNQGNRQRQDQQLFEKEFDFEQANVEFEELRTQMANTKISENGDKKDEKKDDSGHETATTGDESEDSTSSVYYDKTKSFFDSISCEALERSKGKSQRSDWRQERKINVQTFGVATARRGYYPRGRGGYYNRGGYYRNYNNQGYYNNRGNSNYRGLRGGPNGTGGGGGGNMNRNYNGTSGGGSTGGGASVGVANPGGASGNSSYASAVRSVASGAGQ